jgi:hypothetical protein
MKFSQSSRGGGGRFDGGASKKFCPICYDVLTSQKGLCSVPWLLRCCHERGGGVGAGKITSRGEDDNKEMKCARI